MIALFGGTFDPIHNGHLHAASCAAKALRVDCVRMVLAARPKHRAAPIATVYGVYDLATRRVNVPGMVQTGGGEADVSLQAPPADIDAFAALARRLAATDGVRMLLAAA